MPAMIRKLFLLWLFPFAVYAQNEVEVKRLSAGRKIEVYLDKKFFTAFCYPDSLTKPILFPIMDGAGQPVTRGFPLSPRPGEPDDHPHHTGLWLTYEDVNGLDFWNNSYAIPPEKKHLYGWIRTDSILQCSGGKTGVIRYHARWTDQQDGVLMYEDTKYIFSGSGNDRWIDRITVLKADTDIVFHDAKDGLLGLRMSHELQIPSRTDQQFRDKKGNLTIVKKDSIAGGDYLTSEGKRGDSAWSTRAAWCKAFGKIGRDSVSITIFDHSGNPNYPAFWHARGYDLFAVNPLGEKIFTSGKSSFNLELKKNNSVRFWYRIYIQNGQNTPSAVSLDRLEENFNKLKEE